MFRKMLLGLLCAGQMETRLDQEERAALLRQGAAAKEGSGPGGRDMVVFVKKAAEGTKSAAGATCESVRGQLPGA